eukprot:TRINITY_DN79965_c0_g1_i1.p1 TRINITY_DN79965_c0_g1~~TRINITY_DN79965_c0_g1_i1.p1  ORF type:complete len:659 (-),score=145.19 TRINITY_DN79965_c0_g1_i1:17-1966(-)
MAGAQLWEVVGGAAGGGILVREGEKLASTELPQRLARGAVVQQKDLRGERLCFELIEGEGPKSGWVSLKAKGKELLVHRAASLAGRPDWLRPSTTKGKLLLLSIPWKGHIVHLRRIGMWFAGRPGHEVHIACFAESEAELRALGFQVHVAQAEESVASEMFASTEDGFREIAKSDASDTVQSMMSIAVRHMAKFADRGQDPMAHYFSFCFRVLSSVKPDVVVADSFCGWMNLIPAWCMVEGVQFIPVHSPGIPEEWDVKSNDPAQQQKPAELPQGIKTEELAKAMGMPVELVQNAGKPAANATAMPQASPEKMTLLGCLYSVQSLPPQMAAFMAGAVAKKLKVPLKVAGQLLKNAGAENLPIPALIYPSTRSVIGDMATRPGSLFTSPLLPLPSPLESGCLQRDRKTFQATLAPVEPALLDWLFSEDEKGPVVYVAFGSIVQPSKDFIERIAAALDGGDEWRVLWVLSESLEQHLPEPRPGPGRWRIERFVPQADVLKCDRIACFVSHMGANSTTESLVCGVPMMCCPFYMDQFEWAKAVCDHQGAGLLAKKGSSSEELRTTLRRLLYEPMFAERARRTSRMMQAQAEAVMEHLGPEMLPPPGTNLGTGAAVCAAVILACYAKETQKFIFQVVHETTKAAEAAETARSA